MTNLEILVSINDMNSDVFLDNKYSKWYYNIVNNANNRTRSKYTEQHHIIPKCFYKQNSKWGTLEGNSEEKNNKVFLTTKEHYICHLLLTKMVVGKVKRAQMNRALERCLNINNKTQRHRYKIGARKYQQIRQKSADANSVFIIGDNNPMKRDEVRDKVSSSVKKSMQDPIIKNKHLKGVNSKSWLDARAARVGSKSPNVDKAIYLFIHKEYGLFEGTQIELRNKYGLAKYHTSRLVLGKLFSSVGWELFYRPKGTNNTKIKKKDK